MNFLFLITIFILILSVVIHEVSHGLAANYLGDPTAKYAGRLSINPVKHIDPVGSIIVPLFLFLTGGGIIFGWAKPVPINPYNFKDQKYGSAKVSFAGPLSNFIMAIFFGALYRFLPFGETARTASGRAFFSFLRGEGINLGTIESILFVFLIIIYINLILCIFNLIPVPPLDGHHILFAFLPHSAENVKVFLSRYGIFILLFIIFFYLPLIFGIVRFLFGIITGV